jgi:hypothetical protein
MQAHHGILWCAQFGEMVAWNTLPPKLSFNTCDQPAAHMATLASALTKWAPPRCDREQDGDVSWENPHPHHHTHRQVVEQLFSLLHPKTGGAILAQPREEDADLSVIGSYPGHRSSTDFFGRPPAAQPLK